MAKSLRGAVLAVGTAVFVLACSGPAPAASTAPTPAAARLTVPATPDGARQPAAAATATDGTPSAAASLPTTPRVSLDVAVLPLAVFGPLFVAQARGYFEEVGLSPNFQVFQALPDALSVIAQGRVHVGAGTTSAGFFNALSRGTDTAIVADLASAGRTERSTGYNALVVRKDLWDAGTIRGPQDLVGRKVHVVGLDGGSRVQVVRWLRANGVDDRAVEFEQLGFPEMFAAMKNRASEAASTTEPFVTLGTADGTHAVLATQEEMEPGAALLYLVYWKGIDSLGPQVGTRFMAAYLRGARAYIRAFEHGDDLDGVAQVLADNTAIKDVGLLKRIKYAWVDPNGVVNRRAIEDEVALFRDLGSLRGEVDLSGQFDDSWRQRAVAILGESTLP